MILDGIGQVKAATAVINKMHLEGGNTHITKATQTLSSLEYQLKMNSQLDQKKLANADKESIRNTTEKAFKRATNDLTAAIEDVGSQVLKAQDEIDLNLKIQVTDEPSLQLYALSMDSKQIMKAAADGDLISQKIVTALPTYSSKDKAAVRRASNPELSSFIDRGVKAFDELRTLKGKVQTFEEVALNKVNVSEEVKAAIAGSFTE